MPDKQPGNEMAHKEKITQVKRGESASGVKFALVHFVNLFGEDRGHEVWKLSVNYKHGRTVSTWCTCKREMTLADATEYFEKRLAA